jgi:hypothetical protein
MSIDLEDRIRVALQQQATEVDVQRPRPEAVFERVRERRTRRRATRAVMATVAVGLFAFGLSHRSSSSTVQTGRANQPASAVAVPLGHPAMVVLDGWKVNYIAVLDSYTEYQFTDGTRSLQVSFYPTGSRGGNSTNPTEVTVRGAHGVTTDEAAPRYRVDWDEQGQTWEADGAPFTDVNEFLAVLEHLRVIDEATWTAALPHGVGASILANKDRSVTWYDGEGVSCSGPQNSIPCN